MIARIAAIVQADVLIRFRRLSTLIVFLLLSAAAYAWVPDPSSGRALMHIGNRRAVYNSAAIGLATALLASICVGLIGFYVISNAVRRDARSRAGFIMAATPMTRFEYVAGKFAGNVLFLATFTAGFMLTSMAMVIVRGEAPLQPIVFLTQYLVVMPPVIVFVSAMAILFECVPFLRGRFGDVLYFFVFNAAMAVVAVTVIEGGVHWMAWFDISGLAVVIARIAAIMHTKSISIGASPFDPHTAPVLFAGIPIDARLFAQRLTATLVPLPLIGVARWSFHRFDPVRVRAAGAKQKWNLLRRLNPILAAPMRVIGTRNRVAADVLLTLTAQPLIVAVMIVFAIVGLAAPSASVMQVATAVAAILIADVACRDQRAGTLALLQSAPHIKARFVAWKLASSFAIAIAICIVPLARSGMPLAALTGIFFIAATATALAVISSNAKTFIVLFLSFWYVVVNSKGANPALDFAGFFGKATPAIIATYVAVAIAALVLAEIVYRARLRD